MNIRKLICLLLLITLITVAGCMPGDGSRTAEEPAGFFWGVWHGLIAPISLIWGLFNSEIRLYEPLNSGWAYDLGFYITVVGGFSSFFSSSKQKKTETQENSGAE